MVDPTLYKTIVNIIIDNIEGGYYHPNMLIDGRVKDPRYKNSGETMLGIDRKNGRIISTSPAGKKFWKLIDDANAKDTWKWNYKGGSLYIPLRDLVVEMMFPLYQSMSSQYLSVNAKSIVESNPRLLFNFVYATWNGPAWFKYWAGEFNKIVAKGETDPPKLINYVIKLRNDSTFSLIRQSGKKIQSLISLLPEKKKQ